MGYIENGEHAFSVKLSRKSPPFSSSEDELTTDTEGMALSSDTDHVDAKTPRTHSKFYTLATSMRLMVGYEIQRELEEMETEEQELESRGVTMERNLRNRQSVIDPTAGKNVVC